MKKIVLIILLSFSVGFISLTGQNGAKDDVYIPSSFYFEGFLTDTTGTAIDMNLPYKVEFFTDSDILPSLTVEDNINVVKGYFSIEIPFNLDTNSTMGKLVASGNVNVSSFYAKLSIDGQVFNDNIPIGTTPFSTYSKWTNLALNVRDSSINDASIVDGASIAGRKITPDFGNQNILTTGTLVIGQSPNSSTISNSTISTTNINTSVVNSESIINSGNIKSGSLIIDSTTNLNILNSNETTINGDFIANNPATFKSTVVVDGKTTLGEFEANQSTIKGVLTAEQLVNFNDSLSVSKGVFIGGTLNAKSAIIQEAATLNDDLVVIGTTDLKGTVTLGDDINTDLLVLNTKMGSNIDMAQNDIENIKKLSSNDIEIKTISDKDNSGTINITADLSANSNNIFVNNLYSNELLHGKSLKVLENANVIGDLEVKGLTSVTDGIKVNGETRLNGNVFLGQDNSNQLTFNALPVNDLDMNNNDITSINDLNSNKLITNFIETNSGAITLNSDLTTSNKITTQDLTVTGTTDFNGGIKTTFLEVLTSGAKINDTLGVVGNTRLKNDLFVEQNSFLDGNVSLGTNAANDLYFRGTVKSDINMGNFSFTTLKNIEASGTSKSEVVSTNEITSNTVTNIKLSSSLETDDNININTYDINVRNDATLNKGLIVGDMTIKPGSLIIDNGDVELKAGNIFGEGKLALGVGATNPTNPTDPIISTEGGEVNFNSKLTIQKETKVNNIILNESDIISGVNELEATIIKTDELNVLNNPELKIKSNTELENRKLTISNALPTDEALDITGTTVFNGSVDMQSGVITGDMDIKNGGAVNVTGTGKVDLGTGKTIMNGDGTIDIISGGSINVDTDKIIIDETGISLSSNGLFLDGVNKQIKVGDSAPNQIIIDANTNAITGVGLMNISTVNASSSSFTNSTIDNLTISNTITLPTNVISGSNILDDAITFAKINQSSASDGQIISWSNANNSWTISNQQNVNDFVTQSSVASATQTNANAISSLASATLTNANAIAALTSGTATNKASIDALGTISNQNSNAVSITGGAATFTSLRLSTTPTNGHVLTSDGSGNASWQAVPSGGAGSSDFISSGSSSVTVIANQIDMVVNGNTLTFDNVGDLTLPGDIKSSSGTVTIDDDLIITGDIFGTSNTVSISGDLDVKGNITKASGNFKIDHPLDPLNKILYHSFVESNEMLNIYRGTAQLENGVVIIELPEYFSELNRNPTAQFTCIAGYSNLYYEEIVGNKLIVKLAPNSGGKANQKFSWVVYGERNDPWARKHRMRVEVEKTGNQKGKYLYPKVYKSGLKND